VNANTTSQTHYRWTAYQTIQNSFESVKIRGATGHPNIFKAPVTETHQFAA
jgi:hypothetical protein